ncbi:MAG: HAD family phosphatase [Candidatus Marinimicrobia bacterium]|nr:HAD family phosphatase [Candidatus Neomarinimicrobiota bacterium]
MIKAILFDMDGVVVDSEPLYMQAEIQLFRQYGVEIPDDDWKLFRGCTEEAFYKISMERYGIQEEESTFRQKGRALVFEEFSAHLKFMDGFLSLIEMVRKHFSTGLVTSSPGDVFEFVNDRLKLKKYFHQIIFGGMTQNGKPHPEPYLTVMKILDVLPEECVIIEDSIHGINAGLASGAKVIALTGSVNPEDMPTPHRIVNNLSEITETVLREL